MKYLFILCSFILIGCQATSPVVTIIPPSISESQPSWDGDKQNSGIIEYLDGKGFLITPQAAKRYTALTSKFGQSLVPTIAAGEGLIPFENNFLLSPEYMSVFMEVSILNKK